MTKDEIIRETIEFYSNNPRSISADGNCLYKGPNNTLCAFARVIKPEKRSKLVEDIPCLKLIEDNYISETDFLPEYEVYSFDIYFWRSIQMLHDNKQFWNENKLTKKGQEYADSIPR